MLNILKESLAIPFSSIKFIIFTSLSSFPFFTFLFFFNLTLQRFILHIKDILRYPRDQFFDNALLSPVDQFFEFAFPSKLAQVALLYIAPYHLLQFISIATSVDLATTLYDGKDLGFSSLTASLRKLIKKGPFITFVYRVLLSTSTLFGLLWIVTNCFVLVESFFSHDYYYYYHQEDYYLYGLSMIRNSVIIGVHGAGFVALLVKYMEWSGGWNVSVVVSIIGEEYGNDAFEASAYYGARSKGSKMRGGVLMFVFFAWGVVLRVPCLFGLWDVEKGRRDRVWFLLLGTVLICVANVIKWVVCAVYFFDCKKRVLEKKSDHKGRVKEVEKSVRTNEEYMTR